MPADAATLERFPVSIGDCLVEVSTFIVARYGRTAAEQSASSCGAVPHMH
jgi:hypothetical protein